MTNEELVTKGINCLIDNLGYIEAGEFLNQIAEDDNKIYDYTEWRRENLFKGMTDEEIIAGAIEYAKTHHIE